MPTYIQALGEQLGMNAANNAVGAIFGLAMEKHNDKRQIKQQQKLTDMQIAANKNLGDYNYAKQLQMWKDTNYGAQMQELSKAGLNPALLYGMGGAGGATIGGGSPTVSGGNAPTGGGEIMGMVGHQVNMQLANAQREVLESQAELNRAEAKKKSGVDTANVQADTENKILQQIVTDYTGREAKDQYERVKSPARAVEAKTYQDELEARQGIAGTIYELWTEGKLKDKSVAEIEQILLSNAKTREETRRIYKEMEMLEENIKGAKLDNIIKELEAKLQTETGIDKNSPGWLKILGRLFVQLFK